MSSELLTTLLSEYERKKYRAELDVELRKQEVYSKIPQLQKIEEELNSFAINATKPVTPYIQSFMDNLSYMYHEYITR